jgi:threonyl-tRNA synthetase
VPSCDSLKREWQLGTVQVDYNLPERFELEYVGEDNERHRPVMIHRAPFGSMERFIGILIEHFAGAFPVWLAPEQVRIIPVADSHNDYAYEVANDLKAAGVRVTVDDGRGRLGKKIRTGRGDQVPYMLIVGDQDIEAGTVSVRLRTDEEIGAMPREDFKAMIVRLIDSQSMELQ